MATRLKIQPKPAEGGFVDGDKTKLDTSVAHTSLTNNPHNVTKAQVGLGSVPNTDFTPIVAGKEAIAIEVTSTTARTTAVKVGTTVGGSYTPTLGDRINVTFTLGTSIANATLNIDGSGAKAIQIAGVAVSTLTLTTPASSTVIPMFYNGTAWQLYGPTSDTNTTYIESTAGTAVTTTTQTCGVNNLYYANHATSVAFTLPATCALNQVVEIVGLHATGGFTIIAPAGDNISINGNDTGAAGVLTGAARSSVKLRCIVANTTWVATDYTGVISTNTGYQTNSNRLRRRVYTTTTTATLAPDFANYDDYYLTTQVGAITISAPIGTPVAGDTCYIKISSAAGVAVTYPASFKAYGQALPATTTAGKPLIITAKYDGTNYDVLTAEAI